MTYRIVAERENETVRMDRASSLIAVAKARVWASEGWDVTIIVRDQEIAAPDEQDRPLLAWLWPTLASEAKRAAEKAALYFTSRSSRQTGSASSLDAREGQFADQS